MTTLPNTDNLPLIGQCQTSNDKNIITLTWVAYSYRRRNIYTSICCRKGTEILRWIALRDFLGLIYHWRRDKVKTISIISDRSYKSAWYDRSPVHIGVVHIKPGKFSLLIRCIAYQLNASAIYPVLSRNVWLGRRALHINVDMFYGSVKCALRAHKSNTSCQWNRYLVFFLGMGAEVSVPIWNRHVWVLSTLYLSLTCSE